MGKTLIKKPLITEKTINLVNTENQYTFIVDKEINKNNLKDEIETKFKVKVEKIRIINVLGRKVSFGSKRIKGRKSNFKKAIVTLKKGDTISDFEIK